MTLLVLCLAALAVVAYVLSALLGVGLYGGRGWLADLAPAAQARVYLFVALLPMVASVAVLIAALAPSFGWIADHCTVAGDQHDHPHICAAHHVVVWPAISLTGLFLFVTARVALTLAGRVRALLLGWRARRVLDRGSVPSGQPGLRVLPFVQAQAFVLGLVRPAVYVTDGLVSGDQRLHMDAVMAHERAHLQRMDSLRRFVAGIALAFHLPGIANLLDHRLMRAQEMAADEVAAYAVGSRERVAQALVALARARSEVPGMALAFSGSEVESRVAQLMDKRPRLDRPSAAILLGAMVVVLVLIAADAGAIHHGIERMLGALGT